MYLYLLLSECSTGNGILGQFAYNEVSDQAALAQFDQNLHCSLYRRFCIHNLLIQRDRLRCNCVIAKINQRLCHAEVPRGAAIFIFPGIR